MIFLKCSSNYGAIILLRLSYGLAGQVQFKPRYENFCTISYKPILSQTRYGSRSSSVRIHPINTNLIPNAIWRGQVTFEKGIEDIDCIVFQRAFHQQIYTVTEKRHPSIKHFFIRFKIHCIISVHLKIDIHQFGSVYHERHRQCSVGADSLDQFVGGMNRLQCHC